MLPPDIRTLSEIEVRADRVGRLDDAASLLGYVLNSISPGKPDDGVDPDRALTSRIDQNARLFVNPRLVSWALDLRNGIARGEVAPVGPTDTERRAQVEQAAAHLLSAIRELLALAPRDVILDVRGAPPAEAAARPPQAATAAAHTLTALTPLRSLRLSRWLGVAVVLGLLIFALPRLPSLLPDTPERAERRLKLQELARTEAAQKEADSLARDKLRVVADQGARVLSALDALDGEIRRWERDVEPLRSNHAGRTLMAPDDTLRLAQALLQPKEPTKDAAQRLRARVVALLTPVNAALTSSGSAYSPSGDVAACLAECEKEASAGEAAYRNAADQLLAIAKASRSPPTSAFPTLDAALADLVERDALAQARRTAELTEQTTKDEREQTAALAAKDEEASLQRSLQQQETERATQEKLRTTARQIAADSIAREAYEPFFAAGRSRFQRHALNGMAGCETSHCLPLDTPAPVSYAELVQSGALDNETSFARAITGAKPKGSEFSYYCAFDRPVFRFVDRPPSTNDANAAGGANLSPAQREIFRRGHLALSDAAFAHVANGDDPRLDAAFARLAQSFWPTMTAEGKAKHKNDVKRLEVAFRETFTVESIISGARASLRSDLQQFKQLAPYWIEMGLLRP